MIARIFWGHLDPRAWPSIEAIYARFDAASTPGLRARLVTRDLNDPESMYVITLWDDLASVHAWLASADYQSALLGALRPFVLGSQSVSLSEVRVQDIHKLLTPGDQNVA